MSQVSAASNPKFQPKLTPKEDLAFLEGKGPGFWRNWLKSERETIGTPLVIGACLAFAINRHQKILVLIFGGLLVFMIVLFPALHFWFSQTKNLFEKLHTARNWRRWNEVLSCLENIEKAKKATQIGIGEIARANAR